MGGEYKFKAGGYSDAAARSSESNKKMTSKNNICKCTQRLWHDGCPWEQGPRNLPMPQAACVDWLKIATASFYLRLLPLFPPARDVASWLQSVRLLQRISPMPVRASCSFTAEWLCLFEANKTQNPLALFCVLYVPSHVYFMS